VREIADAAALAASAFDQETELGELLWTDADGGRCYYRLDGPKVNVLTILRPDGPPLVSTIVGVDWSLAFP
jgi:hypothetical protein